MAQHHITAIILTAGLASRMERSKLDLPFNNHTIIEEVVSQVSESDINEIVLVTGGHKNRIAQLFQNHHGIQMVHNPDFEKGMTTSIQCGIVNAPSATDGYLVCLGDLPFITTAQYNKVIHTFQEHYQNKPLILRPFVNDIPAHPVVFSKEFKTQILQETNMEGAKTVIKNNRAHLIKLHFESDNFMRDIDSIDDYKNMRFK